MPAKKQTTEDVSGRIALANALVAIQKSQIQFAGAVKAYEEISQEAVQKLETLIEAKQKDLDDKMADVESKVKRRKIDAETEICAHKRKAVIDILQETNETPIEVDLLVELKGKIQALTEKHEAELKALSASLAGKHKRDLAIALKEKDLEHKASVAEIKASSTQSLQEIKALKQTIAEQREEIKAQRELTKSVADAGRQGAISQTFGK
jgi:recombinational DNA repair ATPase RecF